MELNQLIYFRAVANCGSITKAAGDLFITQSALSRTIQRLETEVGAKLFVREKGRFDLSESGRMFLAHVQIALSEIDIGIQEIARNEHRTDVRIFNFLYPDLLENLCDQLQAEHQDISINLQNSADHDGMEHFEQFSPEIVISPVDEYRNYQVHKVCSEQWNILYHRDHSFLEDTPSEEIGIQQVVREPLVFFGSDYDRSFVTKTLNASVFQAPMLRESEMHSFKKDILQGKYIAPIPNWFCSKLMSRTETLPLVSMAIRNQTFLRPVYICCHNGFPKNETDAIILSKIEDYITSVLS